MKYLDITVNKEGYIEFESDKAKIVFSTAETGKISIDILKME